MNTSRRSLLKAAALGGAATLASCERATSIFTQAVGQRVPDQLQVCDGGEIDPDYHLLSRAAFGPWPGEVQDVKAVGREQWIESQLNPSAIDDTLCDMRSAYFEALYFDPANAYEFDKKVLRLEITRHTLLRSIYSKRQLFEVMVEFWTDHLNIDLEKGDCVYLKPSDDREVVRKHALGNFRDLIMASAKSPAMLVYLDGRDNKVQQRKSGPPDKPNENYGRELMELHTLGVSGGYTQDDVREAARCLTGWTVDLKAKMADALNPFKPALGVTYFNPKWHDDEAKKVLGHDIPAGGGEKDIEKLIDIVCFHPSTARYLATKLCHRFVSYTPPDTLVTKIADEFTRTRGDIKSLLRVIFHSDEFASSRGQLFKRPYRFIVSSLRAVGADTHAHPPLMEFLQRMGQGLFQHPTPDGYPDEETPWLGTLLWRWNFGFALAGGKVPTVDLDFQALRKSLGEIKYRKGDVPGMQLTARLFAHCTGRRPTDAELQSVQALAGSSDALGIILASPAFQRC
jgi:uncharacterized protein (DUF1800 family)